jgi:hypothetical protein
MINEVWANVQSQLKGYDDVPKAYSTTGALKLLYEKVMGKG